MAHILALNEPVTRLRPKAPAHEPDHQAGQWAEQAVLLMVTNDNPSAIVDKRSPDLATTAVPDAIDDCVPPLGREV
ncbi:MAG: hypothetical protein OEW83_20220, partial [Acidimicrobiia bacterium]|nr:hypothetical protein [Acidimicrobiia bacterium]